VDKEPTALDMLQIE